MTDPIADCLTRIRNANNVSKEEVDIPFSKIKQELIRLLKDEGFIKSYKYMESREHKEGILRVFLKYGPNKEKIINEIKRISRPGLKVYASQNEIPKVFGGLCVSIVTTSHGLLTDQQCRDQKIGGEILCSVW